MTEETIEIASVLLKPDIFDFLSLMKNNYYPLDKIPKILSRWADTKSILKELIYLKILTIIEDEKKREWLILLADVKPLVFFPEHIFPEIRKAYRSKKITREITRKAYNLLEVTYPERIKI